MSRIDISVKDKTSGELVENRGFCRDTHLSYFCEDSPDQRVSAFADQLFLGVDLTVDNIDEFIGELEYSIGYLKGIDESDREGIFSFYKKDVFEQFLEDLSESLTFVKRLKSERDIRLVQIEVA